MPPLVCPRCQRPNPDIATYCHFDGIELRGGAAAAGAGRLNQEFVFPSGKRCATFDELAQACQDDWAGARELMRQGAFVRYFSSVGRMDLARAAQESMNQADPDIGLTNLVGSLPLTHTKGPRLDLAPRRLMLGAVPAGETRQVPLIVTNSGQGMLQGTLTVSEGGEWLRIGGSNNGQCSVQTAREQQVMLQVDTRGLAAGQPYGAKLTVVTNGGVVEVPARLDLIPHPFPRPPFQGVRSQRELAERMRGQPKAAVPVLESGEIGRWFEANGWNYPVRGTPAKGVAGVQQFFEAMGLSKPPTVQLSQTEASHSCKYPETARGQVALQTPAKKWVYANIESNAPWLRVLTPQVAGPQQAQIGYEIDSRYAPPGARAEASLTVNANGGQVLTLRVRLQVEGNRPSLARRVVAPVLACTLVFLLVRLALVPVIDVYGRGAAASYAFVKVSPEREPEQRPSVMWGGWLNLPWTRLYLSSAPEVLDKQLGTWQEQAAVQALMLRPEDRTNPADRTREFRERYAAYLLRVTVIGTWWIGAVLGVLVLWRRGGILDAPWGLIAGTAAGVAASATIGCVVMLGELGLHWLWETVSGSGSTVLLPVWVLMAVGWWTFLGLVLGVVLAAIGPLGQPVAAPMQGLFAGAFRLAGLRRLADFFAPP
jgi:hypothetical protein